MVEEHTFGHLHLKTTRRQASLVEQVQNALCIAIAAKFDGRGIDRDPAEFEPSLPPATHIADHPRKHALAQRDAEFRIIESRSECVGRLNAQARMVPAQERLEAGQAARGQGYLWLVKWHNPIKCQCAPG